MRGLDEPSAETLVFSSLLFLPAGDFPFGGSSGTRELRLWSMQSPGAPSLAVQQDRDWFLILCGVNWGSWLGPQATWPQPGSD